MADRDRPGSRAAWVLLGVMLSALAGGIAATWVEDGDGTCAALYRPNLARQGCTGTLAPLALASASLLAGAALAWDTARRGSPRPSGRTAAGLVVGVAAVGAGLFVASALDRPGGAGTRPPPIPVATAPPASAPTGARPPGLVTPTTAPR